MHLTNYHIGNKNENVSKEDLKNRMSTVFKNLVKDP